MTISTTTQDNNVIITLTGRLDTTTAPQLDAELEKCFPSSGKLTLDIGGLEYLSSAGLRVVLGAHKRASFNGVVLEVLHPTANVAEVFEITGFTDILNIVK